MKKNNLTSLDEILDKEFGKAGTESRQKFDEGYEAFKLGVIIREARISRNLSQKELAEKCDTNKSYISRIENDASDIRLSTLVRIIEHGLGGRLSINVIF